MARHKKYKFTLKTVLRVLIFLFVVFLLISILAQNSFGIIPSFNIDYNKIYQKVPSSFRTQLESIPSNPVIINSQIKINEISSQGFSFFDNQIKEIKKLLIRRVADDMIKKIDQQ